MISKGQVIKDETYGYICLCRQPDGGYSPSPDRDYKGNSDTKLSDLAAVTYAAVLAKTMGWELPTPQQSVWFIWKHQQQDGSFINLSGTMKPYDNLSILYNTTQAVVALRALGEKPSVDPAPVMKRFFESDAHKKLPWYTTSFFPLFYAALGKPFPPEYRKALSDHMNSSQRPVDGYIQNHVAATFHMAHFYRLIGEETPRSRQMLARVLNDQRPDGGWNIQDPDWDVHALFDAAFILRQLGSDRPECKRAIERGAEWAIKCRNKDFGFGHYPGRHSDMDAVYFQFGALIQAEMIPGARLDLADAHTLGWGHAMKPGKKYA